MHTEVVLNGKTYYKDVRCNGCQKQLKPVVPQSVDENGLWEHLQVDGALHLKLDGGYGELIDPLSLEDLKACHILLCTTCSKKLCDTFFYIKDVVFENIDANIGHTCKNKQVWKSGFACDEKH